MSQALAVLLKEMMKVERSAHLQVGPCERSDRRQGYANGFKLKRVLSSVPWQRCQFHVHQKAQKYVPRLCMKREVAEAIPAGCSTRLTGKKPNGSST